MVLASFFRTSAGCLNTGPVNSKQTFLLAKKLPFIGKPLVVLLIALLLWWLVPTVVKSFLRISFFEFQAPAWTAISYLTSFQDFWSLRSRSKIELIKAGQDLARLNAAYELRNQQYAALETEISRLEKLLQLPSLPEYRFEVARVLRRDLNSWWQQILIRKGKNYGLIEGAAVVFSGGVVGRIKEVRQFTSVVELASSPTFRIAAQFDGDNRPVTYYGSVNRIFTIPHGYIKDVQPDVSADASTPRRIVTTRLGRIFPDGLTIGYVRNLGPSSDGLFQVGQVELNKELLSLNEVTVLIPILGEDALDNE